MRKLISLLTAVLLLAVAAPASAGGVCASGGDHHCPPPKERVLEVTASVVVCGDPRMGVLFESSGDVDSVGKIVYYDGKYKTGHKVVVKRSLPAGTTKLVWPRWIRGGGASVKIRVWNPLVASWSDPLAFKQNRFGDRWGTGDCPASRFGTPTFDDPRFEKTWSQVEVID